jgi:ubiquitin-conjugating enzyme E2 R
MIFPRNYPYSPPGKPWASTEGKEREINDSIRQRIALVMTTDALLTSVEWISHLEFRFLRPVYHPNIYPDGKLCISILHTPGEDETSGELAAERWSPAQRAETVLISILSLLDDAEVSSPANVDAGVMLRTNPRRYKSIVRENVEASQRDIPAGFIMPTNESSAKSPATAEKADDQYFWADSDADDDVFGGSDSSDEDMTLDDQDSGSEDVEDDDEWNIG